MEATQERLLDTAAHLFAQQGPHLPHTIPDHAEISTLIRHITRLFLDGANANVQDVDGNTPLHRCARDNAIDMATLLLAVVISVINSATVVGLKLASILRSSSGSKKTRRARSGRALRE